MRRVVLLWGVFLLACRPSASPEGASAVPSDGVDVAAAWDEVLSQAVTPEGYVAYDVLAENRGALSDFVAWLGLDRPLTVTSRIGRHAFYLNAWQAFVLQGLLADGPPETVEGEPAGVWGRVVAALHERTFRLDGEWVSLRQLKHELIRERIQDYRDFSVLGDGSASGPPVYAGVFQDRGLDRVLEQTMTRWLSDPVRGLRITPEGVVEIPPDLVPFVRDLRFQSGDRGLCSVLANHLDGELLERLRQASQRGCRWRGWKRDARLNDAATFSAPAAEPG